MEQRVINVAECRGRGRGRGRSRGRGGGRQNSGCGASLVYRGNSRTTTVIQRNPALKNKNQTKKGISVWGVMLHDCNHKSDRPVTGAQLNPKLG